MITATIQNSPYCTEMTFPCTETELLKKLEEIGIAKDHLAPTGMVIDIERKELSVLMDCDISLDALNYLGKRMDGMERLEKEQFLAVLSCDELNIDWGLKNIINLTFSLPRYTLIKDTNDLESVGRIHLLNIRGCLSASEAENKEWLAEEGKKLIVSGKGIDTEYGKLFVNEEIEFEETFKGAALPPYYCDPDAVVSVEISYGEETDMVDLPNEDIAIKKAVARLGADSLQDCKLEVNLSCDIADDWLEKIKDVENTKDIFGLNNLLKTEDVCIKQEPPKSVFYREMLKWLKENGFEFAEKGDSMTVYVDGYAEAEIYHDGNVREFSNGTSKEFHGLWKAAEKIYEYCSVYEKAAPLKAEHLSENYRCFAEFNDTVLAAKYSDDHGFEYVTWYRTFDGKDVCQGKYYDDFLSAKEDFAVRSELVDDRRLFGDDELLKIKHCVEFALENGNLDFMEENELSELMKRIEGIVPSSLDNQEQGFSEQTM